VTSYRLRLTKQGTSYTGEVAVDGGEWQPVGTVTHPTADLDLGLFALGVQQPGRTASFDYFRVTPAQAANRPPVADDDSAVVTAGRTVDVDVLSGDTDPDDDTLTVESVTAPGDGSATINADGTVRYTSDAGFAGTDTFDYTVTDGNGGSDTGTVTVTVTEACELETPDDTFEGGSLDTCRWNAIVAGDPTKRRVADGRLVLTTTPGEIYQGGTDKSNLVLQSADHAGEDWVIETHADVSKLDGGYSQAGLMAYGDDAHYVKLVVISDEGKATPNRVELRSEVDNVIVGSNPQPELPIPAGTDLTDMRLRLTKAGTAYEGEASFDGGETWVDLPRAVDNAMTAPRFGVFAAGVMQQGDEVSFDTFLVDGEDPVEPDPVNAAPKAVDDTATTSQGSAVDIDVLANDTDADADDELTVASVTTPAHGTAVVANGKVTYTPDAGHSGTDTFEYVVTDGTDSDTGTVTVTTTRKTEEQPVPDTTITGAPRDGTRAKTATIRFAATGPGAAGATFQCSLDGFAWQACASPQTYRDLSDGRHEVKVRAVGPGGADATPATASWTVDRTGPRVRKVTPKGTTRDRTPKVGATVSDRLSAVRAGDLKLFVGGERVRGVRWDARRDRMTWTPKAALAAGRYTVRLVAEDALGNRSVERWGFTVRR
jgi:cytochrome c